MNNIPFDPLQEFFKKYGRKPNLKEEVALLPLNSPFQQLRRSLEAEGKWVGDPGPDDPVADAVEPLTRSQGEMAARNPRLLRAAEKIEAFELKPAVVTAGAYAPLANILANAVATDQENLGERNTKDPVTLEDFHASEDPGHRQTAIDMAIERWSIDTSLVTSVSYNSNLLDTGAYFSDQSVEIGHDAFIESVGYLGSVIAHETEVHAVQGRDGRFEMEHEAVLELEAYEYQLQNADRFGLTPSDIAAIREKMSLYNIDLDIDRSELEKLIEKRFP